VEIGSHRLPPLRSVAATTFTDVKTMTLNPPIRPLVGSLDDALRSPIARLELGHVMWRTTRSGINLAGVTFYHNEVARPPFITFGH
jgi:hypothetical protein